MKRAYLLLIFAGVLVVNARAADEIVLEKPAMRWLWGGFGFHNSEATMTPMMSDAFRDERVLKTFREISPSYARLFAGFHDWTHEAMDAFADYYDATFRKAGTTLYLVPGRMPVVTADFDYAGYAECVATNLGYLVKERQCTKIRYYALTNEMASGPEWGWFYRHHDEFERLNRELYAAFRRHGLDIGLMTPDSACAHALKEIDWSLKSLNDITEVYCWHYYDRAAKPGDAKVYDELYGYLTNYVSKCLVREKRLALGEWGMTGEIVPYAKGHMRDDGHGGWRWPGSDFAREVAICRAEMGLAAMNAGCLNAVSWSFCDYPDPFLRENGDSAAEKARYDVARFSGWGLDVRYNKNGLFRWDDEAKDYSSYPELYTMGYLAKLFRKGSRVLEPRVADSTLRVGAVTNPDGSCSIAIINWGAARTVRVTSKHPLEKPLRVYEYDSAHPPVNAFNDLQSAKGVIEATDNVFEAELPARSMTFFTTDYVDRKPAPVTDVRREGQALVWAPMDDANHVYYRVYQDGVQVASTVANRWAIAAKGGVLSVASVDRWGNVGQATVEREIRRFVDVSKKCPRYFETADGRPWVPIGINLCYAHPDETTAVDAPDAMDRMETWMRKFAAAGGNYIRLFLCRSTVEVLTDKVGVYDERGAANLKRLIALAEELGLKVKLTLECFRTVKPANEVMGEHLVKCNKPLYAPYAGSTMHGFFTSPKCREIFMGKVKYLKSLGLGDSLAVIDWEPFNEINSCGACEDWMPWSDSVLAEMQAMFPRQMVTQNMGSFSGPDSWKNYTILANTSASAFMQVHRYLDPGAHLRVCRGPMDILCADSIREMRDRRLDRPVLMAETGGVEAYHSRYSKVYDSDREGMLLHDAIFAPFFAGAAGCGCMWHWGQMYIDRWNLWYHYARFAEAIRGIDPVAEDFRPLRFETTLRRAYALVGRKTTLVWLRDETNTWQSECLDGVKPVEMKGECLPFVSETEVDWYLPFEDRHLTTAKGPVNVPRHTRSIVGRFQTRENLRTFVK